MYVYIHIYRSHIIIKRLSAHVYITINRVVSCFVKHHHYRKMKKQELERLGFPRNFNEDVEERNARTVVYPNNIMHTVLIKSRIKTRAHSHTGNVIVNQYVR